MKLKGNWFEIICWYFLKNDRIYQQRFEDVWRWRDWPQRSGRSDTGIDIVAKLRGKNEFCAVQCKFYEHGYCVTKSDVDTFLSASGKIGFAERIIISVADNWNKNAEDAIQNQQIQCTRLTLEAMEQNSIDWSGFELENLASVNYIQPKKLRDDQNEALNAVIDGFKTHDRGKLIMSCGTGKTFTSLRIAEKIAGAGKNVMFLVPSIALLNQTLLAWNLDNDVPLLSFAVCSDSTVGHKDVQNEDMKITDLACPATTKPDDLIRSWNAVTAEIKSQSMTVVFSTYQSLPVILKA